MACIAHVVQDTLVAFVKNMFIYLAAPGLSFDMQDLVL